MVTQSSENYNLSKGDSPEIIVIGNLRRGDSEQNSESAMRRFGRIIRSTGLSTERDKDPFSNLPARPYYRILSGHMEFRPENSPAQEIANDLNVGAVRRDP